MSNFCKSILIQVIGLCILQGPLAFSYADETYPGGVKGTVKDVSENAFGHPMPWLDRNQRREFFVGNSFFRLAWVEAPASTEGRDGLGPTFNAVSCATCHLRDGRGEAARYGEIVRSLLYRLSENAEYGEQLNPFGVRGVPGEASPDIVYYYPKGRFDDGEEYELRQPKVIIRSWAFGRPSGNMRVSARVAPQLIGLGLLEKIPEADILAQADPDDKNADGISGRVRWVLDLQTSALALGRFGWKSEQPNLRQQNAAAFIGDMGLTSMLFPNENCPAPQVECAKAINGGTPEVDEKQMDRVTLYTQSLAVPERRGLDDPELKALIEDGKYWFNRMACAKCHQPSWQIEPGWTIYPYTDMLLHDMGPGLSDRSIDGESLKTEWRTPPLWGIGLIPTVNGHSELLHDGRARSVEEAILWHGGEALESKEIYLSLTPHERRAVVEFINSL